MTQLPTGLLRTLLPVVVAACAASPPAFAGANALPREATVKLVEGLPAFPPLTRSYPSGWSASLAPTIHFVWGEMESGERKFWLLRQTESGTVLHSIVFEPVNDELHGTVEFDQGDDTRVQMRLRLDADRKVLFHQATEASTARLKRGDTMTGVSLKLLDGAPLTARQLAGRWLVINWWATSCVPCVEEIPLLNQLSSANPDVQFLAVTIDDPAVVRRFLEKHPFRYRQAFAGASHVTLFGEEFPRHLIIDPDGIIVAEITGASADIHRLLTDELARVRGSSKSAE